MHYSATGEQFTERFEGCRLIAYRDQKGVLTIGYGHTRGVCEGMTCTVAEAQNWLAEDIAWAEKEVNAHVTVQITQNEFDALVDWVFNVGGSSFEHSTLLRLLNAWDGTHAQLHLIAKEFEKWDMCGGQHVAGLLRRRLAEEAIFLG